MLLSSTNFLSNWLFNVHIGDCLSPEHSLKNGVPKGAVLRPLLFNMAINDILNGISPLVKLAPLADDLALFIYCASPETDEAVKRWEF